MRPGLRLGVVALLGLLGLAACPGDDEPCTAAWATLGTLDQTVALAVQGRGPDDVWVVGGGLDGGGAYAAHWDGAAWQRQAPMTFGATLWWVWTAADDTVWMVGEHGVVVRQHRGATTIDRIATDATIYGVWGAGPDDVWLVGGVPDGQAGPEDDLIRRWDGTAFVTPPGIPARGATLFKVWGAAADDVWISGEGGTMLRWNGAAFVDHSSELATFAPALTVHGCSATEVYAVAGQALFAWDGARWARRAEPVLGSAANGVACGAAGVLVVGNAGLKRRWDRASGSAGPWLDERGQGPTGSDLHGAFVDDAGRMWAVGGNFNAPPPTPRTGVIGARGCPAVGAP